MTREAIQIRRTLRHVAQARRGFVLVITMFTVVLVGGLIVILSRNASSYAEMHNTFRESVVTQQVMASLADRARMSARASTTTQPTSLDIAPLLPAGYEGTAQVGLVTQDGRPFWRAAMRIEHRGRVMEREQVGPLDRR